MAELEASVIDHLIDVERHAATLLTEAQEETDKRLSQARLQADESFRKQFETIVAAEEKNYDEKVSALTAQYKKSVEDYTARISSAEKTVPAFNAFCDKVLQA